MPELPDLVKLLTAADCLMIKFLCYPSMRGTPRLLRLRYGAQAAGLRNREYRRGEFAEW